MGVPLGRTGEPTGLSISFIKEDVLGWHGSFVVARTSSSGTKSYRMRYTGLSDGELIDVIEASLHTML